MYFKRLVEGNFFGVTHKKYLDFQFVLSHKERTPGFLNIHGEYAHVHIADIILDGHLKVFLTREPIRTNPSLFMV